MIPSDVGEFMIIIPSFFSASFEVFITLSRSLRCSKTSLKTIKSNLDFVFFIIDSGSESLYIFVLFLNLFLSFFKLSGDASEPYINTVSYTHLRAHET